MDALSGSRATGLEGIAADHPKQVLAFFAAGPLNDEVVEGIRRVVVSLASCRTWVNGPPQFIDTVDEPDPGSGSDDEPIRSVGGYVEIFSSWPPWTVPPAIDRQHFEEASLLVEKVCEASQSLGIDFELYIEQTFIGVIEAGLPDRGVAQGLLSEWQRHLE